jgi:hypothetical protein
MIKALMKVKIQVLQKDQEDRKEEEVPNKRKEI